MIHPPRLLAACAGVLALLAGVAAVTRTHDTSLDARALARQIEHEEDHVTARELGTWIRERRAGLRVLDVRTDSEFQAYHIPSAERMELESVARLAPAANETIVLYSEGGAHAAQGWVLLRAAGHRQVFFLRGGLLDWLDDVMTPSLAAGDTANAALSRYFGGTPRVGLVPLGTTPRDSTAMTAASAVARLRRRGC